MPPYAITFARSSRRELEALPRELAARLLARIEALALEPRPHGCKKLHGSNPLWRLRVGDYRVVYAINDKELNVDVVMIRHRSEVYR